MANADSDNDFIKQLLFADISYITYELSVGEIHDELETLQHNLTDGNACPKCGKHFFQKMQLKKTLKFNMFRGDT
jgi:anaerobic ribonucleoside-triphosphate reductase